MSRVTWYTWVAWAAWITWAAAGEAVCPAGCTCGGAGIAELTCGGKIYRVRDDGYAEADCQGLPLDCASIPPLPTPAPLHRLELTNCSLPPGAAGCLLRALRSPPPEVLMTMALVGEVGEGAFEGLEGVRDVIMMSAASQTTIPPLSPLSPIHLRVVEGTNVTLPSTPLPPSLRSLEVSNSGVRSLTPAAFVGLNDLETLRVWGNELQEISPEVFSSLPSLRSLSVSRNPLKRLRVGGAVGLVSLVAVRVDVELLEEGDVSGLTGLEELTLESNRPLTLAPRALAALPALGALAVRSSGVRALPGALLAGSHALRNVSFTGNKIDRIEDSVFHNQSLLERLDLSHNSLSAVSRDVFEGLTALRDLQLDYNMITTLPDRMFSSLPSLSSLSLSHNLIASISPSSFAASPLRSLSLAHNRLHYAPSLPTVDGDAYFDIGEQSPLNALLQLQQLDLSYNDISCMFSDWRYVLLHLQHLDLSHNAFTELNSGDLQFMQSELTVDLTHNNVTSVMPPPSYLDPSPHSPTVLLDHNPYACDCNLYPLLTSLPSLPYYRLESARCTSPSALQGAPLSSLDVELLTCPLPDPDSCLVRPHRNRLECTGSDVTTLPNPHEYGLSDLEVTLTSPADLLTLPPYVTGLNMSRLGLDTLGLIPPSVTSIDLTYNKFSSLPLALLEGNHTLSLRGNPLACDCWSEGDIKNLQKYKSKVADYKVLVCASGDAVSAVDASALCGVQRAVVVGSTLAVAGLILAVLVLFIWRYSVEIRLYLGALPGLAWLLDEEGEGEDGEGGDKKWDVFVSFSHGDYPWVRDVLLPVLEARWSVCVHYREWEVGRAIPAQIVTSVQRSRRTLCVLTPRFARSAWAVEEFRAAVALGATERTTRALVVLLEPVAPAELHAEVRDYLALTTYLDASDPGFWAKLRRALPRHPLKPAPAPLDPPRPSLLAALRAKFASPPAAPQKGGGDPSSPKGGGDHPPALDVVLDRDGKLVNRAYVKDV